MSLESAANLVADQIKRQEFVEIIAHHDADGIASGSILSHAMARAGIRFRLRIRREISVSDITREGTCHLLCDLGAGMEDLPLDTLVVDHHQPYFSGEYHANPHLAGIDGDRELSASGMAYYVTRYLCDNRDLAGLALLGAIGDGQEIIGKNHEILNEGVGNGIIISNRGLCLPGRELPERFHMAINPYLPGISGDKDAADEIIGEAGGKDALRLDLLLSLSILQSIQRTATGCVEQLYSDTFVLEREVLPDAHALVSVIDACGKSGHGDLGVSICLRYSRDIDTAWETAKAHRLNVIAAVGNILSGPVAQDGLCEVEDPAISSDVADALGCQSIYTTPVAVIARDGDLCRVSARCPMGIDTDLGSAIRQIARACGGSGGGHRRRAGATVPCNRLDMFRQRWHEAVAV